MNGMKMRRKRILAMALGAAFLCPPLRAENKKAADDTYERMKLLVDVLGYIQDNYVDDVPVQQLVYGAASGMVRTLDPFSQFLDPELNREMKTETEGQFGGVGLRLAMKDDWLTVMTPMPGSPAYRAGILPNDRIAEIDGQPAKDIDMADALKRMRGAPGTKVRLKVLRGPDEAGEAGWKPVEFELRRELIKIESVVSRMLDQQTGYLRVIEFSAKTVDDMADALKELKSQGMTSLVLDLRNNPGGLLSGAVEGASLFLGDGRLIVYTQGRKPESRQDFTAGAKAPYATLPLVVLINGGSASAAEIVTGAMQDYKRAVVVGSRSYGKASVQSLIPLGDGSGLRLTVAHYYTPLGRSIQRNEKTGTGGITPDIVVDVPPDVEAKLYAQWETVYGKDKRPRPAVKPEEMVRDEALERAVELLKVRDVLTAPKVEKSTAPAAR